MTSRMIPQAGKPGLLSVLLVSVVLALTAGVVFVFVGAGVVVSLIAEATTGAGTVTDTGAVVVSLPASSPTTITY